LLAIKYKEKIPLIEVAWWELLRENLRDKK
jgi:hypothetical protein